MLGLAITLLLLAVVCAILGFGGFVAGTLLIAAKWCFGIFLVLAILSFVFGRQSVYNDPLP